MPHEREVDQAYYALQRITGRRYQSLQKDLHSISMEGLMDLHRLVKDLEYTVLSAERTGRQSAMRGRFY